MNSFIFFISILLHLIYFLKANEGDGQPFGSKGPFLDLDETDSLSTFDFFENYVKNKKPVVLRKATKEFRATNLWTDEYLYEKVKDYDEHLFEVETVKKESRNQNYKQMSFKKFLDNYRSKDLYLVSDVPDFFEKDLNLPQALQCEHASRVIDKMVMWFSSGDTKSVIHTDEYENVLCVLEGIKEVVLVNSYKYPDEADILIDRPDGAYSSADVDKVDYDQFPGIEKFEYYKTSLNKGDCLYIPFKWIHQVRSFNRNIAVNYWFNYEKLFDYPEFSDICKSNKFDKDLTLDLVDFNEAQEEDEDVGQFANFKYWIIRRITEGNNKFVHWSDLIVEQHLPKGSELKNFPALQELVSEFFDTLDYDGSGLITTDELKQIEMNRLEHLANLIEAIDSEITDIQEGKSTKKNSKEEL